MIKSKEKILENFVKEFKPKIKKYKRNLVFVCIGSNQIIGDSLGPMVGTKLEKLIKPEETIILGNMRYSISRQNITEIVKQLRTLEKTIVAIDSAICYEELIGTIFVKNGKLEIAKGINEYGISIGDISVKVVTSDNLEDLFNTKIELIDELSEIVAQGIYKAIQ